MESKNYEWYIETDTSEYAGRWIAILNQRIVASGDDAKKVYEEAKTKSQPETRFRSLKSLLMG